LSNPYCEALGIRVPTLEAVRDHPEASSYTLLLVALLERGGPMTLPEVAKRFAEAGVASADAALASLKRCRPARPPVYRDGNHYALDPYDHDLELWVFRLGLRPAKSAMALARATEPEEPAPLPEPTVPLSVAELDEAWREASLYSWSAQRVAICILDAHGGAMAPADVVAFVSARTQWHTLRDTERRWGRPAPVRHRLALVRRWAAMRPDPAVIEANRRAFEERRERHGAELAKLRRVVVHAFPGAAPRAVVLTDVAARELTTFTAEELPRARERLNDYDVIAAVGVRPLLRALGYDPGPRRLAELGPPQKTTKLNRRGRTLRITTAMLVRGSCGIGRPFGDAERLGRYLSEGQTTKLHRRLEADAKALLALYQYGRLHGAVRLRWGFLDEMIPAPWVHRDETRLYGLKMRAHELGAALDVVVGSAPGWKDPWARARRCRVVSDGSPWDLLLVDETGVVLPDPYVQLARLVVSVH
jgi:hypothetical protein